MMQRETGRQAMGKEGMRLLRKPVARVEAVATMLRDGSTGLALPQLQRVWAVAETVLPEVAPCRLELVKSAGAATRKLTGQPAVASPAALAEVPAGVPFEIAFYRKYTEALLRKYTKMRMEAGRVPSMLGREMFRGKVTHYKIHGFDDVVIFCRDMEKQIERLNGLDRQLVERIAMQGYTYGEVSGMVGVSLRSVVRRYAAALDRLTRLLMEVRLLEPQKSCQ